MKKYKITEQDYLKANRKASREEEIALHGKPIQRPAVHQSKKTYNRKRTKAGSKVLPFLCIGHYCKPQFAIRESQIARNTIFSHLLDKTY